MSIHLLNHCLHEAGVTGVQSDPGVELHPTYGCSIISCSERELTNLVKETITMTMTKVYDSHLVSSIIMIVHHHSLHPGVVSVARIINIASIYLK